MLLRNIFIFSIFLVSTASHSNQVALSFDDAPMRKMEINSGKARTERLLSVLQKYKIQTVFFSVTSNFDTDDGLERMKLYDEAGHFIANHTHTHPNFDETPTDDFIDNFNKAHMQLTQFKNFKAWFRFPMLRHGNTLQKRDAMRAHLQKNKYKDGYVTLDIQDWFMADLVNKGLKEGRKINEEALCTAYSELIWDTMLFYDSKAVELLNRSPKHMLLLHENDLAALCLESLITKIVSKNWSIISPDSAMQDEIYSLQPSTLFSNNGQIAALYFEKKGIKIYDPWSHPWNDGELIRKEFDRRKVFIK